MITIFRIKSIEAKAFVPHEEIDNYKQVQINCDINMQKATLSSDATSFKIEFSLALTYLAPSIGHIRFEGIMVYANSSTSKQDMRELKKAWDSGAPPANVWNELANTCMHNTAPIALLLSRATGLPPAIPIPSITIQAQESKRKELEIYQ